MLALIHEAGPARPKPHFRGPYAVACEPAPAPLAYWARVSDRSGRMLYESGIHPTRELAFAEAAAARPKARQISTAIARAGRRLHSNIQFHDRPAPAPARVSAASFWRALGEACRAYHASHDAPLPWAITPAGFRTVAWIDAHGRPCKVKQPAQFQCPPARFWPGGAPPAGLVCPPAEVDETDAQFVARLERRHAANLANLERWCAFDPASEPGFTDRSPSRFAYPAELAAQIARVRAACEHSGAELERARDAARIAA